MSIFFNKENHAECGKVCKSNCLSYTYDQSAKECRTLTKKLCRDNTAPNLPIMAFTKVVSIPINAYPTDCSEIDTAVYCSGVYRITPSPGVSFDVYCDLDTADGPWTVIQNRQNGNVEFFRTWEDYKNGFGDLHGNFWLGNEHIHQLTISTSVLLIVLMSWLGDTGHAQYSTFKVEDETEDYRLTVSGFSGNVTYDGMATHHGMKFSTFNRDNDQFASNCAELYKGGWWYNHCYDSNLNGGSYINSVNERSIPVWKWFYEDIHYTPMMKTKMLLKRSLS
ncbi:angiopoietin-related protein 7-like [Ylistrum balloti]|uniref:angiopoietin-related protein 7-like n=1 Tax=Ylistrum balloti TaxID=509963 RepID=UPI00290581C3|nr:angiopoietin-related protein 7-like [Ylistrum balloti]